jgi:hypothetical protein
MQSPLRRPSDIIESVCKLHRVDFRAATYTDSNASSAVRPRFTLAPDREQGPFVLTELQWTASDVNINPTAPSTSYIVDGGQPLLVNIKSGSREITEGNVEAIMLDHRVYRSGFPAPIFINRGEAMQAAFSWATYFDSSSAPSTTAVGTTMRASGYHLGKIGDDAAADALHRALRSKLGELYLFQGELSDADVYQYQAAYDVDLDQLSVRYGPPGSVSFPTLYGRISNTDLFPQGVVGTQQNVIHAGYMLPVRQRLRTGGKIEFRQTGTTTDTVDYPTRCRFVGAARRDGGQ